VSFGARPPKAAQCELQMTRGAYKRGESTSGFVARKASLSIRPGVPEDKNNEWDGQLEMKSKLSLVESKGRPVQVG